MSVKAVTVGNARTAELENVWNECYLQKTAAT